MEHQEEKDQNQEKKEEMIDETIETQQHTEKMDTETESIPEEQSNPAEEKAKEYLDRYQRTLAEFDNFRKRTIKEKASMYDDGVRDTVEKLLPVVDNLERAVATQKQKSEEEDAFLKGVNMTLKQLKEIFKAMGVEEIPALGEKFDPAFHAAVAHEENDEYGENEIIIEMLKGYTHKEKVIRHSMVKVAN